MNRETVVITAASAELERAVALVENDSAFPNMPLEHGRVNIHSGAPNEAAWPIAQQVFNAMEGSPGSTANKSG